MENIQQHIDQESLQNILSNRPDINLIPESLSNMIQTAVIITVALTLVLVVLFIIGTIRKWKVQSAVLKMQKDVADIKRALAEPATAHPEAATQDKRRKIEIAAND